MRPLSWTAGTASVATTIMETGTAVSNIYLEMIVQVWNMYRMYAYTGRVFEQVLMCFSLCPSEESGQGMAIVLLRSQLSTGCHSGAALAEIEYDGAISIALYRKSGKFPGDYDCCCGLQRRPTPGGKKKWWGRCRPYPIAGYSRRGGQV